ncbi:MAG: phage tail family protein [Clostridia bacterium]|nr:phage tail family protein [Clostridia bacterium]
MRSLKITSENGSSISIGQTNPYMLQVLEGTGIPDSTKESVKSPNQDGSTHIQTLLEDREIELEFGILESDFPTLFNLKEVVCRTLNPKYALTIVYDYPGGSKKIIGRLSGPVEFPEGDMLGYQKAICTIECADPYWTDLELTGEKLAVSAPYFRFPLRFIPNTMFSVIQNKTIVIENMGHVSTPVWIKFFGPALNPVVTNLTTGEFMKINKELLPGEVLEINTALGNKSVMINGVNAFGFIDLDSDFFYLVPGENTLTYDAESGSESAEVIINYNNRYVGV